MRPYLYLIFLIAFVALVGPSAAAALDPRILARQDEQTASTRAAPASTAAAPKAASSTHGDASAQSSASAKPAASTKEPAPTTDAPASTGSSSASHATATGTGSSNSSSHGYNATTPALNKGDLPFEPKITPAMAIAGVILILVGLAYGILGARNRRVQTFISTTYLIGICILVLIVYVMHPPIPDALQGGYLVAVVASGLLIGAFSLVFVDIADGLCCGLGGFCLSMWFLTLKEDGLVPSTAGKTAFIIVLTIAVFALSLSGYTKTWASIVSIAFSAATSIALGIDCFATSGLKEFWLYIWGLNMEIFPFGTVTYPVTRGMRAETAAIVLLAILFIVAQAKLWRKIAPIRKARAARHQQEESSREVAEVNCGRMVESSVARERVQWEAAYGDAKYASKTGSTDSERSSTNKRASVTTREIRRSETSDSLPMSEVPRANSDMPLPVIMTPNPVANDDDAIHRIDQDGNLVRSIEEKRGSVVPRQSTSDWSERSGQGKRLSVANSRASGNSNTPGSSPRLAPSLTTINRDADMEDNDNNSASRVQQGNEPQKSQPNRRSSSGGRVSELRNSLRASVQIMDDQLDSSDSRTLPTAEEALVLEDDKASSVVATLDDRDDRRSSITAWSRHPSLTLDQIGESEAPGSGDGELTPTGNIMSTVQQDHAGPADEKTVAASSPRTSAENRRGEEANQMTLTDGSRGNGHASSPTDEHSPTARAWEGEETPPNDVPGSSKVSSKQESNSSGVSGLEESMVKQIPVEPKVAKLYRADEWAKNAATADKPNPDETEPIEPDSPDAMGDEGFVEAPAPVHIEELLQLAPLPGPRSRPSIERSRTGSDQRKSSGAPNRLSVIPTSSVGGREEAARRDSKAQRPGPMQQKVSFEESPRPVMTRNSSTASAGMVSRQSLSIIRPQRSVSSPIMERPVEEDHGSGGMRTGTVATPPLFHRESTLLGQRENIVQNRMSSLSFNALASNPNLAAPHSDAGSVRALSYHEAQDADNMSLSDRRAYLHQRQSRQSSYGLNKTSAEMDAHQLRREHEHNKMQKAEKYAAWRQSTYQMQNPAAAVGADESRRSAMLNEKAQRNFQKQAAEQERQVLQHKRDSYMRTGAGNDAHQMAMRRLQASAKV